MGAPFSPTPGPCAGTQAQLPSQCQCPDPGVVSTGGNVIVADSNLCPRRLLPQRDGSGNVVSGLVACIGSGQNAGIVMTNQPEVLFPLTAPTAGQSFGDLVLASGSTGAMFRLQAPATAGLFLQTDGTGLTEFGNPPSATVPNPLTTGTINVTTALNVTGTSDLTGAITLGVPSTGMVQLLGLNSSQEIVTTGPVINSKAIYGESYPFAPTTSYPNSGIANNANPWIGSGAGTTTDPDGIVSITNTTTLAVVNTGWYEIDWQGCFGLSNFTTTNTYNAILELWLIVGGNVVNYGTQGAVGYEGCGPGNQQVQVHGNHLMQMNAGTTIQLQVKALGVDIFGNNIPNINGFGYRPAPANGFGLVGVQIVFTRIK